MTPEQPPTDHSDLQDRAAQIFALYLTQVRSFRNQCTGISTFTPQPTDIFITTFAKSGTTLLQQLVYQLKAVTHSIPTDPNGDKFSDIGQVVPFLEAAPVTGISASINEYTPRAWKTHSMASSFPYDPSVGSFIYCVRNGMHIAPSFLDFTLDWVTGSQAKGQDLRERVFYHYLMEDFLGLQRMSDGTYRREGKALGRWFANVKGWLETKRDKILFLVYEDVVDDLPGTIHRISKFLSMDLTEEQLAQVATRCDRKAMAGAFMDTLVGNGMGWDISHGGSRARAKDATGFKHVDLPREFVEMYNEMFYDAFGVHEYAELVDVVRAKNVV